MIIKPRDYQEEALAALAKGRHGQEGLRQLVALATGGGKTIIAALDIQRVVQETGRGAIFMAHRDELITQPTKKIPLVWPEATVGRVKAEHNDLGNQVTVASVQTICRDNRLAQLIEAQDYSLLYIDEAHHATATTYRKVIDALCAANPNMIVVGLTATPVRSDANQMKDVFGEVTYNKSMLDLIKAGYLSDLQLSQIPLSVSIDGVRQRQGDLKTSDIRTILMREDIMESMVDAWKENANSRRTIAFSVDVAHANRLAQVFNEKGVKATSVYGDLETDIRRQRLADFQSGKYQVITNCYVLTEGFDDEPTNDAGPLECIMLSRPTLSQSLYIQMVGRGTRIAPTKENCLVLDFTYNTKRHHIVQLPHLFGLDEEKKKKKKKDDEEEEQKKPKKIRSIVAQVLEAENVDLNAPPPRASFRWPKSKHGFCLSIGRNKGYILIRPTDKDPKLFEVFHLDPKDGGKSFKDYTVHRLSKPLEFDWAFGLAEDAVRNFYEKKARRGHKVEHLYASADWMDLPPTEPQMRTLKRTGKNPTTRGEATDMITVMVVECIISERAASRIPATDKQIRYLRSNNIPFMVGICKRDASRLIGQNEKSKKSEKLRQQKAQTQRTLFN